MLDVIPEDPCCGKRLAKAINAGHKETTWTCPKCGCEMRVKEIQPGGIVVWEFVTYMEVF